MNKPKFETTNLTAENVTKIAEIFPGVVTEGKVNFDLLRSLLGDEVYGDEAYEFTWVGKRAAIAEAGRPIRKTLRPCPEESKNWDTTENLYIEGDNLDVLKLLQESYLGKVKTVSYTHLLRGYMGSKKDFKDKVLNESISNKAELRPLEELETKAATVFSDTLVQVQNIPTIQPQRLLTPLFCRPKTLRVGGFKLR